MKKWICVIAFVLLVSCSIFAQQDMTKVGVIDTARVYQTYFRDSAGIRNYETKRTEFQAEVDKRTAELKELQQKKVNYEKAGETSADGLFTLDALRCIGACGIAPAITINGKVYPKVAVSDVPKIVEEYRKIGGAQ